MLLIQYSIVSKTSPGKRRLTDSKGSAKQNITKGESRLRRPVPTI
jgi:hypothetical protein